MAHKRSPPSGVLSAVLSNFGAQPFARMKSSSAIGVSHELPSGPLGTIKPRGNARELFFDITDIVHFAMRESKVTGIQRVQTRIVGHYAEINPKTTYVLFQHPVSGEIFSTLAAGLFSTADFDPVGLLHALGVVAVRRFPKKRQIISSMGLVGAGRARVLAAQALTYSKALVSPASLINSGLLEKRVLRQHVRGRELKPMMSLPAGSTLVFLGTNWSFEKLHAFAAQAKDDGRTVMQLVHDLIPLLYPQYCSAGTRRDFSRFLESSVDFVSHYLAVSECTKRDLQAYLVQKECSAPVSVLPLAHEFGGHPRIQPVEGGSSPDRGFVLFVGTLDRRKNIEGILDAWEVLLDQMGAAAPDIVFAGRLGWDSDAFVKKLKSSPHLANHVKLLSMPSDEELALLYKDCLCLLLPSHAEGWGLPVGEAAWFGKPSLIVGSTSLAEVFPQGSILLGDGSAQSISEGVARLALDANERARLRDMIAGLPLRSWADVAAKLDDLVKTSSNRVVIGIDAG